MDTEGVEEGVDGTDLDEDQVVTQTGHIKNRLASSGWQRLEFSFRSSIRAEDEPPEESMSVIAGQVPLEVAVPLIARGDTAGPADAVRYARVGDLTSLGFTVRYEHTPLVPGHAAVDHPSGWVDDVPALFGSCFNHLEKGA